MNAEQFQRVAKALADPRRFEILQMIGATDELACQGVCQCFPVSQATVSHHLKELANAGLVESRREGQFVFYRARPEIVAEYAAELVRRVPVERPAARTATKATKATKAAVPCATVRRGRAAPARRAT